MKMSLIMNIYFSPPKVHMFARQNTYIQNRAKQCGLTASHAPVLSLNGRAIHSIRHYLFCISLTAVCFLPARNEILSKMMQILVFTKVASLNDDYIDWNCIRSNKLFTRFVQNVMLNISHSNKLQWLKPWAFMMKIHIDDWHCTPLISSQQWFRQWLWCHLASKSYFIQW